jgi:hypothetical protein
MSPCLIDFFERIVRGSFERALPKKTLECSVRKRIEVARGDHNRFHYFKTRFT